MDYTIKNLNWSTNLQRVSDPDTTRYAFGCVQATPIDDHSAYCCATDGRALAVAKFTAEKIERRESHMGESYLIPAQVGCKRATVSKPRHVSLNGDWSNTEKKSAEYTAHAGRFPRIGDILADVNLADCRTVTLSADILSRLIDAVSPNPESDCDNVGVTFFVPSDSTKPVALAHNSEHGGVGVIMPMASGMYPDDKARAKFTSAAEFYASKRI